MENLKIEKGVPIPKLTRGPGVKSQFRLALERMETGDSVFLAGGKGSSLSPIIAYFRKQIPGIRFTVRSVEGGVRVWRIE
jgi:hypothetical protein